MTNQILQVFYSVFSAVILSLACQNEFLYFGSPFLGLIALIPLYIAVSEAKSFKNAGFLLSLQLGLVNLLSSFWLKNFQDFAIFTLGGTTLVYIVLGYFVGCFLYFGFYKSNYLEEVLKEKSGVKSFYCVRRIFIFSLVWVIWEWVKSTGFLAYPWGTLFMTSYKWISVKQIASITGVYGITFLFALFSCVIGEGIVAIKKRYLNKNFLKTWKICVVFCLSLFLVSCFYGFYEINKDRKIVKKVDVVLVQHNVETWSDKLFAKAIYDAEKLTEEAIELTVSKPDIVVWPESILSYPMPFGLDYYQREPIERPFLDFVKDTGVYFLVGGPVVLSLEKQQFSNSALFFDSNANLIDTYGKIHLVPFAEGIPFEDTMWMQKIMDSLAGFSKGWTKGKKYTIFSLPLRTGSSVLFSSPICFEDAFPDVCRKLYNLGSELFINITNDSWSLTKSAEYQHFAVASFRTIETRSPMIRCTNSGFTTVISPIGTIMTSLPLFESNKLVYSVPIYEHEKTVYSLFGDWFCFVLLIFLVINIFYDWYDEKIKKQSL